MVKPFYEAKAAPYGVDVASEGRVSSDSHHSSIKPIARLSTGTFSDNILMAGVYGEAAATAVATATGSRDLRKVMPRLKVVNLFMINKVKAYLNDAFTIKDMGTFFPWHGATSVWFSQPYTYKVIGMTTGEPVQSLVDRYKATLGDRREGKAKKQNVVAKSSASAKYRSMSLATPELQWLSYILCDFEIEERQFRAEFPFGVIIKQRCTLRSIGLLLYRRAYGKVTTL
ncbi:hypothetical protein M569_00262 [Genlisea aurea]|uniref:Uncharacterized protein n=1 Tax=Genlisea aurea TaxID=192259 RepID=S8DAG6_9LAMI|nr:hypothetical protein M569_00262 [Genlisea aurea]